ncbi:hypothetical protein HYX18_02160 [Candidatus Woesearchaeota archaeon]|nr:hypothetical protein [Candidatus Woesearchaeota archaeon]
MKVLILYTAALGLGHKRSAQAIEKSIKKLYINAEVVTLNGLSESTTNLDRIIRVIRLTAIKLFPYLLKLIYKYEESILKTLKPIENSVYNYYKNKFDIIIKKIKPDIIVCTHAFPCTAISKLNKDIPLIYVVTDFDILTYHLRTKADVVLVPNEEIKSKMSSMYKKIYVTGIPIDPEFSIKKNKNKLLSKFNLENKPTVLVLGGGSGIGYFEKIINLINNNYQIIACVGTNKNLKNKLESKFTKIKVFGYTKEIDEIYRVSDIVITKPGGVTSSELLAMQLPILITNPLPGIEQKNSNYLVSKNVAINTSPFNELKSILNNLINDKKAINLMKASAAKLASPESAIKIAKIIKKYATAEHRISPS